jgi:hypothetical protein
MDMPPDICDCVWGGAGSIEFGTVYLNANRNETATVFATKIRKVARKTSQIVTKRPEDGTNRLRRSSNATKE